MSDFETLPIGTRARLERLERAAQQALAFNMRDFASLRDFEAAKAVLHDNLRAALAQQDKPEGSVCARCGALAFDPVVPQQAEPVGQLAELQAMLRAEVDRLIAAGIQPQRKLVPLTEEEIDGLVIQHAGYGRDNFYAVVRAVERAHGIKE